MLSWRQKREATLKISQIKQYLTKEKLLQLIRYSISGGTAIAVYYVLLYALTELLAVWYMISASIATIVSLVINFTLHKFWTFKNYDLTVVHIQFGWYTALKIALSLANVILLYILVDYLSLHYLVASVLLTIILSLISFILTNIIFSEKIKKPHQVWGFNLLMQL